MKQLLPLHRFYYFLLVFVILALSITFFITQAHPSHIQAQPGSIRITALRQASAQSQAPPRNPKTTTDQVPIRINNQPPTISVAANTACGLAPLNVNFSVTGSDPEGSEITYKWTFGDGGEASGANVSHTYQSSGTYTAKVVATDIGGAAASASVVIKSSSSPTQLPPQSGGTTYYVAPTGSDTDPGTSSKPFRTIQKASNVVNPGDTVIVRDGIYTWESGMNNCLGKAIVCMPRGGAANNWVVFKSEHKWGAKLDGQEIANDAFVFDNNINYVRVEGFDIFRTTDTGGSASGGISGQAFNIYSGGSNVQIVGNHIHNISNKCTTDGGTAIYIKKNNVLVESNLIHDIRNFALGEQGCTLDNPNHSHGIYLSGNSSDPKNTASGAVIRNNVFFGITSGWPIHIYPGTLDNIKVFNNTLADTNPRRDGLIIIYRVTLTNSLFYNNIFYQPNTSAFFIGTSGVTLNNVAISHNLTTSKWMVDNAPSGTGIRIEQNQVNADARLVNPFDKNPDSRDFRLQTNSPAIDAGLSLPEMINDYGGCARPQGRGYDIGAFEHPGSSSQAAISSPQPHTGLYPFSGEVRPVWRTRYSVFALAIVCLIVFVVTKEMRKKTKIRSNLPRGQGVRLTPTSDVHHKRHHS